MKMIKNTVEIEINKKKNYFSGNYSYYQPNQQFIFLFLFFNFFRTETSFADERIQNNSSFFILFSINSRMLN